MALDINDSSQVTTRDVKSGDHALIVNAGMTAMADLAPIFEHIAETELYGVEQRFSGYQSKALGSGGPVAVLVDSLTAGAGGSNYRDYLLPLLRARTGIDGGPGYHSFVNGTSGVAFYKTSGWKYNSLSNSDWGSRSLDGKGLYVTGGTGDEAEYFSWEFSQKWSSGRILYLKGPSSGSFEFTINNQGYTLVDTYAEAWEVAWIDLQFDGDECGALKFRSAIGDVFIQGIHAVLDPNGLTLANLAVGGRRLTDVAAQDSALRQQWYSAIGFTGVLLDGGMNDRDVVDADQHYADLTTIVSDVQAALPECAVWIIQSNEPGDWESTYFIHYTAKKQQVALELGCGYFDVRWWFGSYDKAVALGLMADGVHPNDVANRLRAQIYDQYIGRALRSDVGATPAASQSVQSDHTLSTGQMSIDAGATETLYDLGVVNGYPVMYAEIHVVYSRSGTSAGVKRTLRGMLKNATEINRAGIGSEFVSALDWSGTAGDGQSGDVALEVIEVDGRAKITATADTYGGNLQWWGVVKGVRVSQPGILVYEN